MIKKIFKHWPLILLGVFLIFYLFIRYYPGHDNSLMEAKDYLKNFDPVVYLVVGAWVTYCYSWKQKRDENTEHSKIALRSASLVLLRQYSILVKSVKEAIEGAIITDPDDKKRFTHTKWGISAVSIKIHQSLMEKILLDNRVCKYPYLTVILQVLSCAEDCFRDCIGLVERLNKTIDASQKADLQNKNLLLEAIALVENIREMQKQALHLNDLAREGLEILSDSCFKELKMPTIESMKPFSEIAFIKELFASEKP